MKSATVTLKDQSKLIRYDWAIDQPKAHLFLLHGYAEHAGRYGHFCEHLNDMGIYVTSYDQRGYGKSDGTRAYIDRFEKYVSDMVEIRAKIGGPVFIMGHSMGGLVALQYVLNQKDTQVKGLISSSAALEIDKDFSPILQRFAPILGWLFPKLQTEKLDKTHLTRDPKVLESYMNDPLNYLGGTRARTGAEMLKAIKQNSARFNEVNLPLLVLHGAGDRLTMPGGSQNLYDDAKSNDKTLKMYPKLYHELIHEPEKEMVMNDIGNWILERSKEHTVR